MCWFACFLLLAVAVPVVEGHGIGEEEGWGRNHTGHLEVVEVEGYLVDDSATITLMGKTIRGKFSVPMMVPIPDFGYYAWGAELLSDHPLYEDVGERGCYYEYERSDALAPAKFESGGQTIVLKDFPIELLPYYSDDEQKGLRLKISYSYKEHGEDPVKHFVWMEC